MAAKQLSEIITSGGIRSINFFNGRLLTAEDLTQEQAARAAAEAQLGKGIGSGVAWGLEVSHSAAASSSPVVTVQPGAAINSRGQALCLSSAADISLVRPAAVNAPTSGAVFQDCQPPQPGAYLVDE